VLVVGSANVDFTVAVPRLPTPGETVSDGTLLVNHGGKGANQAVAACRLGAEVRLIASVGDDASGRAIRDALATEGIGVDGVVTTAGAATGTALIAVDPAGRNLIAVAPGANRSLAAADLDARTADFAWAQVVVVSLEIPLATAAHAFEIARRSGARTILNPAPVPAAGVDFWHAVDIVTPNEGEAARLSGVATDDDAGALSAASVLRDRGANTVVLTLGRRGAIAVTGDGVVRVPAFAVDAIDTTAAGDAFNAGLAVASAEGATLERALRFACATAGLACTRRGAQPSLPRRADVQSLLAR
jgi:ribokinase